MRFSPRLLVIDIETKSTTDDKEDALNPFKNEITCIGVINPATGHGKVYRDLSLFKKEVWDNPELRAIGHNFKFDYKNLFFHIGPPAAGPDAYFADTRLMAFVSTEKITDDWLEEYEALRKEENAKLPTGYSHRAAKQHSLKTLAPYFLEVPAFWEDPTNHDSDEYVLKDCKYTGELYHYFKNKMVKAQFEFYQDKLLPWSKMLLAAELQGLDLDVAATVEMQSSLGSDLAQLEKEIEEQWHEHFEAFKALEFKEAQQKYQEMFNVAYAKKPENLEKLAAKYAALYEKASAKMEPKLNLGSPKQLTWLLKERLNLNIRNLEGDESTGVEVLERLAVKNPEVKKLLEYRATSKTLTAFLPSFLSLQYNGRIHTNFNPDGTRTGRLSSDTPNLQQVPGKLKHLFRADSGKHFAIYDLGAIEPVILAYFSQDPALCDLIVKGQSFHSLNAIELFNLDCTEKEVKSLYPSLRDIAKTVGLAVLYGAGKDRVRIAAATAGVDLTEAECKEAVSRLRKKYEGVWSFKQELDAELEQGATLYNLMGRPVKIYDPEEVYMKGMNTLIQGSASDLTLQAAYDISLIPGCIPVAFVHDSVMTLVDDPALSDRVAGEFTKFDLTVNNVRLPLTVEGGISNVWE